MRVTILIKILIWVFVVFAGLNVLFSVLAARATGDMNVAYENRREFLTATYNYSTHSLELTKYARIHVVNTVVDANMEPLEEACDAIDTYWNLLNNDTRIYAADASLRRRGATGRELSLVGRAKTFSDRMREIEAEAINLVDAGEIEKAIILIYGYEVVDFANSLSEILYELEELGSTRFSGYMDEAYRMTVAMDTAGIVLTILFALISIGGTIYILREVKGALYQVSESAVSIKNQERLRATAEVESRAKTQFLARMSHEIRTPMNAVLGITEIELMKANHPKETEDAFLRIHSSSKLLLAVINDILDLSKVEAGKMEIVPVAYETYHMIMDTVMLNLMHIGSKDIKFDLSVNEFLPVFLIGDELRIKQILNNFLSNAFKYTKRGTVKMSVGKVTAGKDKIILTIVISDTGQGMTPEQADRLFSSEFERYNVTTNRSIEGTGLGMPIAHQLLTMMNGTVSVKSEAGVGSVFTIKIPQSVDGGAVLGKDAVEDMQSLKSILPSDGKMSTITAEPMPYGRVLTVDDIESNLYVVEGFLAPYKIQLETVSSGQEAIDKIDAGNVYDIIFMDHMMPDMDGLEATKILREKGYTAPIVALTANTVKGAKELFISNGFTDFIAKPIDLFQLNAQLMKHIRDKQPQDVIDAARAAAVEEASSAPASDDIPAAPVLSEKIVLSFLRDAKKAIDIMAHTMTIEKEKISPLEIKAFSIQAHGLKSALANIQRNILSSQSKLLEDSANTGDLDTIYVQTPEFIISILALMDELAPEPQPDAPDTDPNPELLKEQLQVIADACDAYDKKTAQRALKTLREQVWSAKTTALLTDLEAKFLHSEFEEAIDLINKFI
jgi:signal transduction histidine kinase/CheY-like chemotaxis protein